MLYYLLYPLRDVIPVFNVFRYITFRVAAAIVTALLLSWLFGPRFIRTLRRLSVGQNIRDVGPQAHQVKAGTPTMGGLLILFAVLVPTLLWGDLKNPYVVLAMLVTLAFGAIGFADDYLKVKNRRNLGLTARSKFWLQVLAAAAMGVALVYMPSGYGFSATIPFQIKRDVVLSLNFPTLFFPFFKSLFLDLGYFYIPFLVIVLVGASNAVNLTDGLDGLAIGATSTAAATYAVFTYVAGNKVIADFLQVPYVRGVGEVSVFCAALVGAGLGFLWFNSHPAEVFMGDVGSLSLGAAIGSVAVLAKQEILLVVVGGLFVLEALSVIIQVASFKLRGKRVFRMAPLHHHFELSGWAEPKVIVRFWILSILFALLSLSTLKLR
jgi:phospho-N-acetylmuramoyl-pentapeptide-transferase